MSGTVLLDLDGTLADPREGIVACYRHALAAVGHPCPPDSELERLIGPPLHETLPSLLGAGADRHADALRAFRERFSTVGIFENELYGEVPEALAALRALGLRLMLATSKPTVYARQIVAHFGLGGRLDAVYGSELDGTFGNKGDLIAHLIERERLDRSRSVMVGDRMHDCEAARANGVKTIGVLWGYGSLDELEAAGVVATCARPRDLPAAVARVLGLDSHHRARDVESASR